MYLYVRGIDFTYSRAPELIPFAWWGRAAHHFIFFVLSCYVSLRSEFRVGMSITISVKKRCSGRLCLQLFLGECMSYLRYLCLFSHSGVQCILCCVFVFVFVFCFCFFFGFRRLVYPVASFSGLSFFLLHLRYSLTFIFYPFYIFLLIYWILELFRQCRFFWFFSKFYYECEVQYRPIVSLSYGHCIFLSLFSQL